MKIRIEEHPALTETEIIIQCSIQDETVENVIRTLRLLDLTIVGSKLNTSYLIHVKEIYYFESVEEKIYCYTKDEVYETKYKLYELESLLKDTSFVRVSKTTILNIRKIKSFKSILSGRVECVLKNQEKVMISRMYVKDMKLKMGMKRGEAE